MAAPPDEETPLLAGGGEEKKVAFRRSVIAKARSSGGKMPARHERKSVRGAASLFMSEEAQAIARELGEHIEHLEPVEALAPLVAGGVITTTDGYKTGARPASVVKSLPAYAPFCRKARHRSFHLFWLNEFRHWWKSRYARAKYEVAVVCWFTS
jgi:hypothetical protein